MVSRRAQVALLLTMLVCSGLHNGGQQLADAAESSTALLLDPSATDVLSSERGGTDQLSYHVDAKFPASNVIGWISQKLREAGWQPLAYDFLNPKIPSSQVRGWEEFLDGTSQPMSCIHQWLGNWKDASGDIVTYAFRYTQVGCSASELSDPEVVSNLTDLQVAAIYSPAAVAQQQLQAAEQFEKEHPGAK